MNYGFLFFYYTTLKYKIFLIIFFLNHIPIIFIYKNKYLSPVFKLIYVINIYIMEGEDKNMIGMTVLEKINLKEIEKISDGLIKKCDKISHIGYYFFSNYGPQENGTAFTSAKIFSTSDRCRLNNLNNYSILTDTSANGSPSIPGSQNFLTENYILTTFDSNDVSLGKKTGEISFLGTYKNPEVYGSKTFNSIREFNITSLSGQYKKVKRVIIDFRDDDLRVMYLIE